MSPEQDPKQPEKSDAMIEADIANGESPETDPDDASPTGPDGRPVEHPTGVAQAEENLENDPPA